MSIDLSNPEVERLRVAVLSKGDPTTWFLLHYDTQNPSSLVPLASGDNPSIPQIREHLSNSSENLVYGYADIQGKGLVLAYMAEGVGGVRRARAVVHSRAVASLFPDYSALVTISQSSELTDGLVNEKLGLDQPSSQVQSSSNPSTSPYAAANVSQGNPPTELPITDAQVKSDQPVNGDAGTSAVPDIEEKELSQPTNNVPQLGNPLPNPAEDVASPSQAFEHSRDLSSNEHGGGEHGELPPRPSSTVSSVPAVTSHSHLGATLIPQVESLGQRSPTPPAISRGPTPPPMKEEPGQTTDKDIPQTPGNGQFQPESNLENDLALAQQGSTVPTTSDPVQQDSTTPSGQPAPLPSTGPLHMQTVSPSSSSSPRGSTTIAPDRPLDMKGISSSDVFPDQRQRKASLTSRLGQLGQAFGRGSGGSPRASGSSPRTPSTPDQNTSAPAAQSNAKSPSSPTIAKFINSNLVKNFGRRVSGSTSSPTASPRDGDLQSKQEQQGGQIQPDRSEKNAATGLSRVISDAPPPVPPKDHPSPIAEQADHRTTNLDPPATFDRSIPPTPPPHDLPNNPLLPSYNIVSSSNPPSSFNQSVDKTAGQISPSPSAKLALSAARENTVKNEMEIQERFRRDQEEKMRLARERAEAEEAQAPVARQPDDAMDDSEEEGLPYDRPTPPQSPARPARRETGATNGTPTRAIEPQPHQGLPAAEIASPDVNAKLHALDMAEAGVPGGTAVALSVAAEQHAKQLADEREESTTGPTSQGVGNEALSNPFIPSTDAEVQDGIQAGPVPNVDEERNAGAEAEEQAKLRAEAQAQLETETQARLATEARERDRLEAEKARLEADRLKKAEEERQALEMKAEAERQRKAQLRAELLRGKQSGGNMLSGAVTVQTTKSTIWRRRHFELYPHEMQLFKAEGDIKPIQTISLGPGCTISHTYEESQVQDSFKVVSGSGEEFFLFTDSPDDRDTVLEGLAIATGA